MDCRSLCRSTRSLSLLKIFSSTGRVCVIIPVWEMRKCPSRKTLFRFFEPEWQKRTRGEERESEEGKTAHDGDGVPVERAQPGEGQENALRSKPGQQALAENNGPARVERVRENKRGLQEAALVGNLHDNQRNGKLRDAPPSAGEVSDRGGRGRVVAMVIRDPTMASRDTRAQRDGAPRLSLSLSLSRFRPF